MKKKVYYCSECGAKYIKWSGRCSQCDSWDTLVEEEEKSAAKSSTDQEVNPLLLSEISSDTSAERWITGVDQFDSVVGGGIVPASLGLLGGSPGVGKSTLILQLISRIGKLGKKILYASGEESAEQIKMRSARLNIDETNIHLLTTANAETIIENIKQIKADFVVVDSIQTISTDKFPSGPGSMIQVKESALLLQKMAKSRGIAILLIGHVTKDGYVAGPKTLEHLVDYVIYLELGLNPIFRYLHSVKNRYGALNELGLFKMTEKGLAEVKNVNAMLFASLKEPSSGLSYYPGTEGGRVFIMEVQALVGKEVRNVPFRQCAGIDKNRLHMQLAVLEKHADFKLGGFDIYINIAGGFKSVEPSVDMAMSAAILSSYMNLVPEKPTLFLGEISLTGRFHLYSDPYEKVMEAEKVGFKKIFLPVSSKRSSANVPDEVEVIFIKDITELKNHIASSFKKAN